MMMTRVCVFLLALHLALFSSAQAAETHPLFKEFVAEGGKVESLGKAYGTEGWLTTDAEGQTQAAYTTPEGGLIVGILFGPDGRVVTEEQLAARKKEETPEAPSKSEKLFEAAEKANWVAFGDKDAPYIYVFFNVNCDHCQGFWKDMDPHIAAGKLQMRLIPFGKSPENRDGGAALLSAEKPEEAWRSYVTGDKAALSKEKIKEGAARKMDDNTALVDAWKLGGPPFTLYRRPGDGKLSALVGRPENALLLLAEVLK